MLRLGWPISVCVVCFWCWMLARTVMWVRSVQVWNGASLLICGILVKASKWSKHNETLLSTYLFTFCIHNKHKTRHYALQLAAHLTVIFFICMMKQTYYHYTHTLETSCITTSHTHTPLSYRAYKTKCILQLQIHHTHQSTQKLGKIRKINILMQVIAHSVNTTEVPLTKALLQIKHHSF